VVDPSAGPLVHRPRDEQLIALRAELVGAGAATLVPTTALYGMAGIGKTQLALGYAHRYRTDYDLGWWVPAESQLSILTALSELGVALGMPARLSPAALAARARDMLGERSEWLLIFDNAPDPAAIAEFLPGAGGGHVLVTSRNSAWQGIAEPFAVDLLAPPDAIRLLVRRSGDRDEQAADVLAEELGRLPLALEQAAAYASVQHLSLRRYLELYQDKHTELLARGIPVGYPDTVDATFSLALESLREHHPAAAQLLEICALLAPDQLPVDLLLSESESLPEPLVTGPAIRCSQTRRSACCTGRACSSPIYAMPLVCIALYRS
jgi:hypothetical protein